MPGSYTVYTKDANGCQTSKNILVTNPLVPQTLTATITNSSCNNSNGSIVAAATGGVAPLQYSINGSLFQVSTSFAALAAGTYTVTVKDANSCTKTLPVVILNLAGPTCSATSTLSSCFANDGTITVSGIGGTGALTYSRNGVLFQSSPVFNGLAPGSYTITVKDAKGCLSTTVVSVGQVSPPVVTATFSSSFCGENIVAIGSLGVPAYQYNINNSAWQSSNSFTCLTSGTYTICIMDANGCKDTVIITVGSPLPMEIISFTGHAENDYNTLEWITASEKDNDFFTLEKSASIKNFQPVSIIDGAGFSSGILNYSVRDSFPFPGKNYYRLKQTNFSGNHHYSNIILLNNKRDEIFNYTYNSELNQLSATCNECHNQNFDVELIDNFGRVIYHSSSFGNYFVCNTENFAKAIYTLHVTIDEQNYNFKVMVY
ncbi:MAG: hypothetical protein IPP29_10620 [Bacteroidetes bacterium]|nr:hypothetical protein [Bacteroidota bacterium]